MSHGEENPTVVFLRGLGVEFIDCLLYSSDLHEIESRNLPHEEYAEMVWKYIERNFVALTGELLQTVHQIVFELVANRLEKMEAALALLVQQRTVKDWYTTEEVAQLVGKAEFTVREWCRHGRIRATKRDCGRGRTQEWKIAHAEIERYRNEGLLPVPPTSTKY